MAVMLLAGRRYTRLRGVHVLSSPCAALYDLGHPSLGSYRAHRPARALRAAAGVATFLWIR